MQAYAWPGLADIFLGLVLRLLGWEGKERIQRTEIARGKVFRCKGEWTSVDSKLSELLLFPVL